MRKILIVDDDKDLSLITADTLEGYGYAASTVESVDETFDILTREHFDLILLDINLPDGTGFEVCQELRSMSKVPVIFASARTSEDDKIHGLDMGGDDYIEKPYSLKELLARINALIRRAYGDDQNSTEHTIGDIKVSTGQRRVTRNGEEVKLALKEYDLLAYMCANMDKALGKEQLLHEVWGAFSEAELSTVAVHIRWLREKLEQDPSNPTIIKTVWGVGYMLSSQED